MQAVPLMYTSIHEVLFDKDDDDEVTSDEETCAREVSILMWATCISILCPQAANNRDENSSRPSAKIRSNTFSGRPSDGHLADQQYCSPRTAK